MPKFKVQVRCTCTDTWEVEAQSAETAVEELRENPYSATLLSGGEYPETDYSTAVLVEEDE